MWRVADKVVELNILFVKREREPVLAVVHLEADIRGSRPGPLFTGGGIGQTDPMSTGSLTLAQIAELLTIVNVRCTKCDRRGRYRISTLIERYGASNPALVDATPNLKDCWPATWLARRSPVR